MNSKPVIGALFICTASICSTLAFFLSGIIGALNPSTDMMMKSWMYTQQRFFVPYWLAAVFIALAAAGVYLILDRGKGKQ